MPRSRGSYAVLILLSGCTLPGDEAAQDLAAPALLLVAPPAGPATADGVPLSQLPAVVDGERPLTVTVGAARLELPAADGVLTYVRSADDHEPLVFGAEIDADRLAVVAATRTDADSLAAALDAEVSPYDGVFVLSGDELWTRAAAIDAAPGITEVIPLDLDGGLIPNRPGGVSDAGPDRPRAAGPALEALAVARAPSGLFDELIAGARQLDRCPDPIGGVWTAPAGDTYHQFTLAIEPAADGTLRGAIDVRISIPGYGATLDRGGGPIEARMTARGHFRHGELLFEATSIDDPDLFYYLDRFTGRRDARGALTVVNNDGGIAIDEPYTFTRVSCRVSR